MVDPGALALDDQTLESTKDCEKDKELVVEESNTHAGVIGAGPVAADIARLQANAQELLRLSSPFRRSLFGGAGLAPATPLTHSTPASMPPLEDRSRSGLSTDGEFDF